MTKNYDALSKRMKKYEDVESQRRFMPTLPIVARLDGNNFHKFTEGMDRPVDERFRAAMIATTAHLVKQTHAKIGYTQSDEITLIWHNDDINEESWYDGRILKTNTRLAAIATAFFGWYMHQYMPEYANRLPSFDARANNVPNMEEAVNNLLWREEDATCNSLKMLAQAHYPHHQLFGKDEKHMHDMLHAKGINWDSYPASFKRGTYVGRQIVTMPFTTDDLAALPPKHAAHTNKNLMVERSIVTVLDMPIFSKVTNKTDVVFSGATPETANRHKIY